MRLPLRSVTRALARVAAANASDGLRFNTSTRTTKMIGPRGATDLQLDRLPYLAAEGRDLRVWPAVDIDDLVAVFEASPIGGRALHDAVDEVAAVDLAREGADPGIM